MAEGTGGSVGSVDIGVNLDGTNAAKGLANLLKASFDYLLKEKALREKNKELAKQQKDDLSKSEKMHASIAKSVFMGNFWLKTSRKLWREIRQEVGASQEKIIKFGQYTAQTGVGLGKFIGAGIGLAPYGGNSRTAAQAAQSLSRFSANTRIGKDLGKVEELMRLATMSRMPFRFTPGMTGHDVLSQFARGFPELSKTGEGRQYAMQMLETLGIPGEYLRPLMLGKVPGDEKARYEVSARDKAAAEMLAKSNMELEEAVSHLAREFNTSTAGLRSAFRSFLTGIIDFGAEKMFAGGIVDKVLGWANDRLAETKNHKQETANKTQSREHQASREVREARHNLEKAKKWAEGDRSKPFVEDRIVPGKGGNDTFVPADTKLKSGNTLDEQTLDNMIHGYTMTYDQRKNTHDEAERAEDATIAMEATAAAALVAVLGKAGIAGAKVVNGGLSVPSGGMSMLSKALNIVGGYTIASKVGGVAGKAMPAIEAGAGGGVAALAAWIKNHHDSIDALKKADIEFKGRTMTDRDYLKAIFEKAGGDPEKAKKILLEEGEAQRKSEGRDTEGRMTHNVTELLQERVEVYDTASRTSHGVAVSDVQKSEPLFDEVAKEYRDRREKAQLEATMDLRGVMRGKTYGELQSAIDSAANLDIGFKKLNKEWKEKNGIDGLSFDKLTKLSDEELMDRALVSSDGDAQQALWKLSFAFQRASKDLDEWMELGRGSEEDKDAKEMFEFRRDNLSDKLTSLSGKSYFETLVEQRKDLGKYKKNAPKVYDLMNRPGAYIPSYEEWERQAEFMNKMNEGSVLSHEDVKKFSELHHRVTGDQAHEEWKKFSDGLGGLDLSNVDALKKNDLFDRALRDSNGDIQKAAELLNTNVIDKLREQQDELLKEGKDTSGVSKKIREISSAIPSDLETYAKDRPNLPIGMLSHESDGNALVRAYEQRVKEAEERQSQAKSENESAQEAVKRAVTIDVSINGGQTQRLDTEGGAEVHFWDGNNEVTFTGSAVGG